MNDDEALTDINDEELSSNETVHESTSAKNEESQETSAAQEYQSKLEAAMQEIDGVKLRCLAEMDNYKKRLQREKEEQAAYAAEKLLLDILPTLDNLDLALQYGKQAPIECKDMLVGVEMTRTMLLDALKKHGLISVGEVGQAFDPNDHEAVGNEADTDVEKGCIIRILQRGYRLGNHLLRPARVIVAA